MLASGTNFGGLVVSMWPLVPNFGGLVVSMLASGTKFRWSSGQHAGLGTQRRWSSGQHAGLWYPSSRIQTWPKPSDFSGEKIHSMPSFGGEVKPSAPCRSFAACKKNPYNFHGSRDCRKNLVGH